MYTYVYMYTYVCIHIKYVLHTYVYVYRISQSLFWRLSKGKSSARTKRCAVMGQVESSCLAPHMICVADICIPCVYVCVYVCVCMCVCVCMYVYTFAHTHSHTHWHMWYLLWRPDICIPCVYVCVYVCVCMCVCVCIYVYTFARTHSRAHSHIWYLLWRQRKLPWWTRERSCETEKGISLFRKSKGQPRGSSFKHEERWYTCSMVASSLSELAWQVTLSPLSYTYPNKHTHIYKVRNTLLL